MKRASFLLLAVAACNGNGRSNPQLPDAAKIPMPDAAPIECLMPASMATVTPANQEAHAAMADDETSPSNYYYYGDLNADASPDVLLIDLYLGYGAFENGWPTQQVNIALTGPEIDYSTCGACVLGLTDYTADGATGDPYMATSGTMTLMTAGPSMLKGTLTNVQLAHVTIDDDTAATTAHSDGCTSMLGSFAFEAAIQPQMAFTKGQRVRAVLKPQR